MSSVSSIGSLKPGRVTVEGRISQIRSYRSKKGYLVTRATVTDRTGSVLCLWFNNKFIGTLKEHSTYRFTGNYKQSYGKMGLFQSTVKTVNEPISSISTPISRAVSQPNRYTPAPKTKKGWSGWGWAVGFVVLGFVVFGGQGSSTTNSNNSRDESKPPESSSITEIEDRDSSNKPAVKEIPKEEVEEEVSSDETPSSQGLSNDNTYTNTYGNEVHSPAYSTDNSVPTGASAKCRDGTYSFSQSRRGTCSHHGGVATWL